MPNMQGADNQYQFKVEPLVIRLYSDKKKKRLTDWKVNPLISFYNAKKEKYIGNI